MNVQRTNITLPQSVIKQLHSHVPAGKRSTFIAEAITEKLRKEKDVKKALRESLQASYELDKEVMEDWKVTEVEGWPE